MKFSSLFKLKLHSNLQLIAYYPNKNQLYRISFFCNFLSSSEYTYTAVLMTYSCSENENSKTVVHYNSLQHDI